MSLRIFILAACLVLGIVPDAAAMFPSFWASSPVAPPPAPPPSTTCGEEPAPPQAVAAGMTICAANFDFRAPTGSGWLPVGAAFSGPVSTLSNWFDCQGNTNIALPFHYWNGASIPCDPSVVTIGTDGGTQVLELIYNAANAAGDRGTGESNSILISTAFANSVFGGAGNTNVAYSWPTAMYIEAKFRTDGNHNGVLQEASIYTGQNPPTSFCSQYAFDFELFDDNGGGFNNAVEDRANGCEAFGGQPGGYYMSTGGSGPFCLFNQATTCLNAPPGGYNNTSIKQPHVYGILITSDGATQIYAGAWLDNTFQQSDSGNLGSVTTFTGRNIVIMNMSAAPSGGNYGANNTNYIQYVRIWVKCATWATTQCNGSTLVNGPPPALTYWH